MESPEIDQHVYGQLFSNLSSRGNPKGKYIPFNKFIKINENSKPHDGFFTQ